MHELAYPLWSRGGLHPDGAVVARYGTSPRRRVVGAGHSHQFGPTWDGYPGGADMESLDGAGLLPSYQRSTQRLCRGRNCLLCLNLHLLLVAPASPRIAALLANLPSTASLRAAH